MVTTGGRTSTGQDFFFFFSGLDSSLDSETVISVSSNLTDLPAEPTINNLRILKQNRRPHNPV